MWLAIQSFPFHYECFYHLLDVVPKGTALWWALPIQEAHQHDVINFYAILARNKDVSLYFLHFKHLDLQCLLKATKIIVLTDDDKPAFDHINGLKPLHNKTIVWNHSTASRYPAVPHKSVFVHQWNDPSRLWSFTCSNLISPKVKCLENIYFTRSITVGIVGTMNDPRVLTPLVQRIVNGTPDVHFHVVSRFHNLSPLHKNWTQHTNVSEPELFKVLRSCTHVIRTESEKPSGTMTLAISLLLPLIRPSDLLESECLHGVGYDPASQEPITLHIPTLPELMDLAQDRDYFIARNRQIYEVDTADTTPVGDTAARIVDPSPIPRIMHHMWLSSNRFMNHIPLKYKKSLRDAINTHWDFQHKVWTNDGILELLGDHFPDLVAHYRDTDQVISRADQARFWSLYVHGGMYFDLDFYVTDPDGLLNLDRELVLFREIPEHTRHTNQLYNGIVASTPKHPFVKQWIDSMARENLHRKLCGIEVMQTTGPIRFFQFWESLGDKAPRIQAGAQVMPLTNRQKISSEIDDVVKESPIFGFTNWCEGSDWSGGEKAMDIIAVTEKTSFINDQGECFDNAHTGSNATNRMFDMANEQLVLGVVTTFAILCFLLCLYFLFPIH